MTDKRHPPRTTILAPSGRRYRIHHRTRMERVGAFTVVCMALIVSGMLWWAVGQYVWSTVSGWIW